VIVKAGLANPPPLHAIILAATSQDVRLCSNCGNCDGVMAPGMDLTFSEVLQAAACNDPAALTNDTLWSCDDLLGSQLLCPHSIDIAAVIITLAREATSRGFAPI
jgi:heterodisulfide reductase subunit C